MWRYSIFHAYLSDVYEWFYLLSWLSVCLFIHSNQAQAASQFSIQKSVQDKNIHPQLLYHCFAMDIILLVYFLQRNIRHLCCMGDFAACISTRGLTKRVAKCPVALAVTFVQKLCYRMHACNVYERGKRVYKTVLKNFIL